MWNQSCRFLLFSPFSIGWAFLLANTLSLIRIIKEKGFVFENYDKICWLLRSANASVDLVSITQISPLRTIVAVDVRLKAKEFAAQGINIYSEHQSWIRYEQEWTTLILVSASYELNKQRSTLKNYKVHILVWMDIEWRKVSNIHLQNVLNSVEHKKTKTHIELCLLKYY